HLQIDFAELVMNRRLSRLDRHCLPISVRRLIDSLKLEEAQAEIVESPHIIRLVNGRLFEMFCGIFVVPVIKRIHPFFVSGTVIFGAYGEMRIARGESRSRQQKAEKRKNQA